MKSDKYFIQTDSRVTAGLFDRTPLKPATFVIFGATGDLTMRILVPALYNLSVDGQLPDDFKIISPLSISKLHFLIV